MKGIPRRPLATAVGGVADVLPVASAPIAAVFTLHSISARFRSARIRHTATRTSSSPATHHSIRTSYLPSRHIGATGQGDERAGSRLTGHPRHHTAEYGMPLDIPIVPVPGSMVTPSQSTRSAGEASNRGQFSSPDTLEAALTNERGAKQLAPRSLSRDLSRIEPLRHGDM